MNDAVRRLAELLDELAPDLRSKVLTHSSWTDELAGDYERLAFLGDSVLGMVMADELLRRHPGGSAGDLTKIRAQAASRLACARVAESLGLAQRMANHAPTSAELPVEDVIGAQSVMAEVCEAVIGAAFEQFGYARTAEAVAAAFAGEIVAAEANPGDYKSRLQEFLARRGERPEYVMVAAQGPAHARHFECVVEIRGDRYGSGTGSSKKEAEQSAAEATLAELEAS